MDLGTVLGTNNFKNFNISCVLKEHPRAGNLRQYFIEQGALVAWNSET